MFNVSVSSSSGIAPTGNVSLKDGSTVLQTKALTTSGANGVVTFTVTNLTVGTHNNITAVYAGNATSTPIQASSTSNTVTRTVRPKLVAVASPSNNMAPNALFSITASARDSNNNVVPTWTGTGNFTLKTFPSGGKVFVGATNSSNGTQLAPNSPLPISYSGGVATISGLRATTVGTYTFEITATNADGALTTIIFTMTISTGGGR